MTQYQKARPVEAYDLVLFAQSTGPLYSAHKALVGRTAPGWRKHVRDRVVPLYYREIEPVYASVKTINSAARDLRRYYEREARETAALRGK